MGDHFDTLRRLGSLAAVSDEGVTWLADHVEAREFGRGDVLIRQGETTRECYFTATGQRWLDLIDPVSSRPETS